MTSIVLSLGVSVGLVVCWSSGFIGTQLAAVADLPARTIFFWRFLIAAGLCVLVCRVRYRLGFPGMRWTVRAIGLELAAGSFSVGVFLLGVVWAIDAGVSAGITSLITALQPLLAALTMSVLAKERIGWLGWLGAMLAAIGVVISISGNVDGVGHAPLWAYGLPCLSAVSLTAGSILSAHRPSGLGLLERLALQLAAAAAVFLGAHLAYNPTWPALPQPSISVWYAIAWLVVLSSFGGYGFFIASLRLQGVNRTSILFYLTPPVTMVWAGLQFGETVPPSGWVGGSLTAIGVALSLRVLWVASMRPAVPGHATGPAQFANKREC